MLRHVALETVLLRDERQRRPIRARVPLIFRHRKVFGDLRAKPVGQQQSHTHTHTAYQRQNRASTAQVGHSASVLSRGVEQPTKPPHTTNLGRHGWQRDTGAGDHHYTRAPPSTHGWYSKTRKRILRTRRHTGGTGRCSIALCSQQPSKRLEEKMECAPQTIAQRQRGHQRRLLAGRCTTMHTKNSGVCVRAPLAASWS